MAAAPIRITADEVNCLIYSYFKDSGFAHSAYTLCNEGALRQSPYFNKHIRRGELIELLSKSLLYLEVESHCRGEELTTNCKNGFNLLETHVCSADSLRTPVNPPNGTAVPVVSPNLPPVPPATQNSSAEPFLTSVQNHHTQETIMQSISTESFYGNPAPSVRTNGSLAPGEIHTKRKVSPIRTGGPAEKRAKREPDDMQVDVPTRAGGPSNKSITSSPLVNEIAAPSENGVDRTKRARSRHNQGPVDHDTNSEAIMMLPGHRTEVFVCTFNPTKHALLATGSKDAVVNLWSLPDPPASREEFASWNGTPITINNFKKDVQGDLTSLSWNPDGTLLAIGSYDTVLRIVTPEGEAYFTHHQHRGPIFTVKFSDNGKYLLSASLDETTCLWDVQEKRLVRQYRCHNDCCLDVEWLDATTFMTAGADGNIYAMKTNSSEPIKKLGGHTDEINQIKRNPSKTRLASCSDDNTTRIWKLGKFEADSNDFDSETIPGLAASDQMVVLMGHTHSVSMIGWLPGQKPGLNEVLATSSFDDTVRIWDTTTGRCLQILNDHKCAVYALAFSPDGKWLATGSGDGWLFVYWVKTWEKKWAWYAGQEKPGVFEITWQMEHDINRIALALECRQVAIIDVTRIPALQDPPGQP